jgi:uncharacterized protein (DUF488 family)
MRRSSVKRNEPTPSGRQQLLLRLLAALGGESKNLDFQKILFLYSQEPDSGAPYEFVPYKFGAFSFTSYADRRKLVQQGLLEVDEHIWKLTPMGRACTGGSVDMLLAEYVETLEGLQGEALVAETYRRYPYYATRSEIANRVLRGEPETLARIQAEREVVETSPLKTIGYEGHSLESYLNVLLKSGVTTLCDVRRNPLSRKYGFSKSTLANACLGVGVRYEHLPELGIGSDQRQDLRTQEDYDALFEVYEREWLPDQQEALSKIQGWMANGERVALTCYERLPHQCHRHCVAEALERMAKGKLVAKHL